VGLPLPASRVGTDTRPGSAARVRSRAVCFWTLLALYAALTVCVLVPSPLLALDHYFAGLHLKMQHPGYRPWINRYVLFGQRGPATLALLPLFAWMAWRTRSKRPLVLLGTALVLLNVSVGVVKYAIGRVGPMRVGDGAVHDIFAGGNIYPSGHVSNAVVLYGLLAWVAPRLRKTATAAAVSLSITVGLSTIYLRTHWFSDVVGGWLAGALVLLSLPTVLPYTERGTDRLVAALKARYVRRRSAAGHRAVAARHVADETSLSLDDLDEPTRVG